MTDACGAVQGTSEVGGAGGLTYVEEDNASVNHSFKIEIKRLKTCKCYYDYVYTYVYV